MRKKSSEISITQVLAFRAFARKPLSEKLHELQMPVTFMHGEYDWVTSESAQELINQGKVQGCVNMISDSGHHLYIENSVGCVSSLLSFTHDEDISNQFISSIM